MLKLGLNLNAPRPRLCLADFVIAATPAVPAVFGHQGIVVEFGMFLNDRLGDCVIAGAIHETMIWTAEGGNPATFTDSTALYAYKKIAGYNPNDPNSDQGTDMDAAAKYRRKHGILDARRKSHKIGAYVDLNPKSLDEVLYAAYTFGACGIGIEFPAFAMDQFNAGQAWDVQDANSQIEGGHYIPVLGRIANGNLIVVTWGKVQQMTPAFFAKYCDQAIAYLSTEVLTGGKSPEGLDLAALKAALAQVTK